MGTAKKIRINETDLVNEADLEAAISELRVGLDQIDRAILMFERLASKRKPRRCKPSQASSVSSE